jgi:hypothetical protein
MGLGADVLRTMLKRNLHGDAGLTDPDDYNTFLTLGQEMMVQDSPSSLGVKEGSLNITSAARKYALASDFYQMRGVFNPTVGWSLDPIPQKEFIETVERLASIPSGPPRGYSVIGIDGTTGFWQISFDYTPDQNYTLKYWYYWVPAAITGTAVPPVSAAGFDTCLVWAATKVGLQGKDPSGYALALEMYENEMKQFRNFDAQGPDRDIVLSPSEGYVRAGSTLRLPPQFPSL